MSIVLALVIFEIIIIIHEFGHFFVAKLCGVKVNEFAIGMGPAIIKKQKGETLYALRLFPIGGYCSMEGEDKESSSERAFCKQTVSKRMAIVIAGIVMNIILGFVLIIIQTSLNAPIPTTQVSWFEENAKSQSTGLEIGDEIIKVNEMRIFTPMDMSYQFQNDEDSVFDMTVIRNGEKIDLQNVAFATDNETMYIDFKVQPKEATVGSVISYSLKQTVSDARLIYISLGDLVTGKYLLRDLSGPVGIVDTIGQVINSETDAETGINWSSLAIKMLSMGGFITINIGLFNLLPLPALDGGRLIFLIIEAIRRKPVPPEKEGMVHFVGLAALLILMVAVTVSDVLKLF